MVAAQQEAGANSKASLSCSRVARTQRIHKDRGAGFKVPVFLLHDLGPCRCGYAARLAPRASRYTTWAWQILIVSATCNYVGNLRSKGTFCTLNCKLKHHTAASAVRVLVVTFCLARAQCRETINFRWGERGLGRVASTQWPLAEDLPELEVEQRSGPADDHDDS